MKRIIGAIAICLLVAPAAASAAPQAAYAPAPAASPAVGHYSDPAMEYTAPADYRQLNIPPHDPADFQQPAVVAAFVKNPGSDSQRLITISMQNWDGFSLTGFEGTYENETRSQVDSFFVSKKEQTKLANGMPAFWLELSVGSGFSSQKWFQYEWVDGVRAVTVSIKSKLGQVDEQEARDALSKLTGVAYPRNRS
ncbi:MAG: hypothetical protein ACXWNK_15110 [Vulcanimicrobiaceae bacterium]